MSDTPFAAALAALTQLQKGITLSEPSAKIERVFGYPPQALQSMDCPAIINRLFVAEGTVAWGAGEHRVTMPTAMIVVTAYDDPAEGEEVAVGLMWGLLSMLVQKQTLGGAVAKVDILGVGPAGDFEYPAESGQHFQQATVTAALRLELPVIGSGG